MKSKLTKSRKILISRTMALILINLFIAFPAIAQDPIQLRINSTTDVTFNGTSNVHDWDGKVTVINGNGAFDQAIFNGGNIQDEPVKEVQLTIPVKSMESGKGKMNEIMYDALKANDHPQIRYELISSEIVRDRGDEFLLATKGNLTVAGVTQQISLQVKGERLDGQRIRFKGNKSLQMTDFKIKPPKALFGAIKSGNAVNVRFTAVFHK